MKRLLLCLAVFSSIATQAQYKDRPHKILIGFNFSPDYSFRTLKNTDGSAASDIVINSRNDFEQPKFGYTTGLNACINFSQPVAFETGIQFSNKGYTTKNQYLNYIPSDPASPVKARYTYAFEYIGIPVKAKFSFGKNKVRFISGIGLMTNFLLHVKQTSTYEYADGTKEKKSAASNFDFKKIDISPMLSIGIDYKLNKKLHLFAEPTFRYGITKTIDAPVTEHLWSSGLNCGFYYAVK